MGKSAWVTPTQALEEMKRRLPCLEPDTLAFWARDGELRARADQALLYDGVGYTDFDNPKKTNAAWWEDVWSSITNPCTIPNRNRLNWTAGELVVFRGGGYGYEEITVRGLEFHRMDLTRCIRSAKGEKEPVPRANPATVTKWVDEQVQQHGLEKLTERGLKEQAIDKFTGLRGASSQAVQRLREMRSNAKIRKTTQNS